MAPPDRSASRDFDGCDSIPGLRAANRESAGCNPIFRLQLKSRLLHHSMTGKPSALRLTQHDKLSGMSSFASRPLGMDRTPSQRCRFQRRVGSDVQGVVLKNYYPRNGFTTGVMNLHTQASKQVAKDTARIGECVRDLRKARRLSRDGSGSRSHSSASLSAGRGSSSVPKATPRQLTTSLRSSPRGQ